MTNPGQSPTLPNMTRRPDERLIPRKVQLIKTAASNDDIDLNAVSTETVVILGLYLWSSS
ncbi:hypothetical protein ARMSODRAFT_965252 [Armillaria solidipes]|uniref:Uncharacterized protein n=1 Tax=Armillaria solidipes TaxID=1076256 RepID=A0A2H3BDD7_9AGAR|nr:hypothetical protein ARMSODRAFT_965252 [Armillaria solidipes]